MDELSLQSLESSIESEVDISDTSDEEGHLTLQRLRFEGESDTEEKSPRQKRWHFWKNKKPLSVQSGDIIRSSDQGSESLRGCKSFYSKAALIASTVFNWIMKIVFFHKKVPVVSTFLLTVNVVLCIVLVWAALKKYPPVVNISLHSFTVPTHPAQQHWDSLLAAKAHRYLNSTSTVASETSTRLKRDLDQVVRRAVDQNECAPTPGQQSRSMSKSNNWNLEVVYRVPESVSDKNLLTKARLSQIHKIENDIYTSSGYAKVCHKASANGLCDRLTSLITSLYPTKTDGNYVYDTVDGFTPNLTASLLQFKNNPELAYWYTGGQLTIVKSTGQIKARLLRSQLSVGLPLPCFDGITPENVGKQKDAVYSYFESLVPFFEQASTSEVEVLYGGTALYDYQVETTKIHDALLAVPSFLLVVVVVFILSGFSVWLTVVGLYSVFSCFPWAFFVYRIVLDIETVGILNIISLFVVIGIGVDDVFVFINTFKQTARLKNLSQLHQRLGYTILTAGKATFFTSLTTSVAFFANAVSSIPAVKQFGLFMGLVVIFCYIQVLIVLPLSLHIWHCVFRYCEYCYCYPCSMICRAKPTHSNLPPVRMSELGDDDTASIGIVNGNDRDSLDSEEIESAQLIPSSDTNPTPSDQTPVSKPIHNGTETVVTIHNGISQMPRDTVETCMETLTTFLQLVMLHCIARPLLFFHLWRPKRQLHSEPKPVRSARFFMSLMCVGVYVASLAVSAITVFCLLRFTDHPPQLFNSNTNIQKMLDLTGNLSETGIFSCPNGCGGGSLPYIPPPSTGGSGNSNPPTNPPHSTPSKTEPTPPDTTRPLQKSTTLPSTQPPLTTHSPPTTLLPLTTHSPPTTLPPLTTHSPPTTLPPPTTHSPPTTLPPPTTHSPPTTLPLPTTQPPLATTHLTPLTTHVSTEGHTASTQATDSPTLPPSGGGEYDLMSPRHSNNVVVNVVFGIKDIVRKYNSSHVIPEGAEGDYALQEDSFYGNFTCKSKPGKIDLRGSIRALCRICTNISNPNNGLILNGNFNCFPSLLVGSYAFRCLKKTALSLPECIPLLRPDTKNVSVSAGFDVFLNQTDGRLLSLRYLAMAFRSTTNPNESPFNSIKGYQQWEAFLSEELAAIKQESGPGELYEGADQLLSSGFQTSETWSIVNLEIIAVYGSLYGIMVSALLCILIIVLLTHNWRIVLAVLLTILNIVMTLLACFVAFGWNIGIVEAITLSIVVGNSLDYCIHLSEGYMSASSEHISFVEQFKFMSGASIRVKRVAASISSVGVSIISSAVTTVLATLPMLATKIELFTRFGQILLLDTLLAITYTLVFCSTFLALFGPSDSKFTKWRALNAVVTITTTILLYVGVFLLLYILSVTGTPILTPEGTPLFT